MASAMKVAMGCGNLLTVAVVAMVMAVAMSTQYQRFPKGGCDKFPFPGSRYRYLQRGHYGKVQYYDCPRGTQFDPRYCQCVRKGYGRPGEGLFGGTYIGSFGKGYNKGYGGGNKGYQGGHGGGNKGYQGGYGGGNRGYQGGYGGGNKGYDDKGYDNGYDKGNDKGYGGGYNPGGGYYGNTGGFGPSKGFGFPTQFGKPGLNFGLGKGSYCSKAPEPGCPDRYRVFDPNGAYRVYLCEKGTVYSQQRCQCISPGW